MPSLEDCLRLQRVLKDLQQFYQKAREDNRYLTLLVNDLWEVISLAGDVSTGDYYELKAKVERANKEKI